MRRTILFLALTACTAESHPFRFEPLPELVVTKPPTATIASGKLLLEPGERMIWDVSAKGFVIARAELVIDGDTATSKVKTSMLASSFTSIDHQLVTAIDRDTNRATTGVETLTVDGEVKHNEAAFAEKEYALDGQSVKVANVQTIHTAIGLLRGWVAPEAHGGFMPVLVGGSLYRLEVDQPGIEDLQGKQTLRIYCRIVPPASAKDQKGITGSIWFTTDEDHVPVRIEIGSDEGRLVAELVERTHA